MNAKELIAKLTAEYADVAPNKVKAIVKSAFETLHAELEAAPEGKLVSPLGAFRVSVKTSKDGETKRRITLSLAKAKEDKPDADEERTARRAARKAAAGAAGAAGAASVSPEERAARRAARKAAGAKAE